ncbi:hypothetical protein Hypma_001388 [Hypsizygus marmoreus]|uniref:MYND-type domain-containing protein n=1 Tax=Hypsizygus marmoreus TaxID=39966 RepID=A0A369K2V6_HYPMA|nr:hypothetical protein Hypma_001388 [Hypsizygus marmoreus]
MAKKKNNTARPESQAPVINLLLAAALRDPHNPRFCCDCLIGGLDVVFARDPNSKQRDLAKHHDVWNALVHFVTARRTKQQMQHLLIRLSQCDCNLEDPQIRDLHKRGEIIRPSFVAASAPKPEPELWDHGNILLGTSFPNYVFALLGVNLPTASVTSVAKGVTYWPSSPAELLPSGPDGFVEAMLQWYDILQDTRVFVTCGEALRLSGTVLLASMISHAFCSRLVTAGRSIFDRIMVHVVAHDLSPAGYEAAEQFCLQLKAIQQFLHELQKLPIDLQVVFLRENETKLCQLCSLLLHVLTDPRFSPSRKQDSVKAWSVVIRWGQLLYRLFHMYLPPRPLIPLHPAVVRYDEDVFPPDSSVRSPQESAMRAITTARKESRCSGLDCDNSLQTAGKSFARCARCNIVTYCGRDCQVQDWRSEKFPHKAVCLKLRNLVVLGGGWPTFSVLDTPLVLENWLASGVDEADLVYINDWWKERAERRSIMPDGTEWTPGFEDYDSIVWQFGASGKGPKPRYPNRLARWPSEVAKEKALLEALPFWEQDID